LVKFRRIRWVGRAARVEKNNERCYKNLCENDKGINNLARVGAGGMTLTHFT
jgi:hypothetical protein